MMQKQCKFVTFLTRDAYKIPQSLSSLNSTRMNGSSPREGLAEKTSFAITYGGFYTSKKLSEPQVKQTQTESDTS